MTETPAGHAPLESLWPWSWHLPGARLVATRFDPRTWDDAAFARCGIALPARLHDAAAKRRAEFLAGRRCARRALWQLDGREASPGVGDDRAPRWPADCVGAITHSHGWAAALVAYHHTYLGLGLDAERLLDTEQARRLARRVLTPGETACLARLPAADIAPMVTSAFSLKESLFKALYPLVGKMFHFQAAELVAWPADGTLRLRLLVDLGHGWSPGREVTGAVCMHEGRLLSVVALPAPHGGVMAETAPSTPPISGPIPTR